jgi:hypothetical protein
MRLRIVGALDCRRAALLIGTAIALPQWASAQAPPSQTVWAPGFTGGPPPTTNWLDSQNWSDGVPNSSSEAVLSGIGPPQPTLFTDVPPIAELTMNLGEGSGIFGPNTLDLQGHTLTAGSVALSAGTITSTSALGTLITNALTIDGGTISNVNIIGNTTVAAGAFGGNITNTGTFTISGAVTGGSTFTNANTMAIASEASFAAANYIQAAGSTTNSGTLSLTGQLAINGGAFNNSGTIAAATVTNAATFNNAGTVVTTGALINAGIVNVAPGGSLTAGSVANAIGGIINNAGIVTDALTNAGTVNNNATYNAIVASNSGTINNNAGATWTGAVQSNTGTINNAGTWNANQGPINNAGTFNYVGGNVVGVTTFANAAGGILSFAGIQTMANTGISPVNFVNNGTIAARAPTDRLTINGTLSGSGTINTVVTSGNASVVTVQGTSSGSQNISVTNSASTAPVFNSPQTVLALNGGGSLTVANKGLVPQISNGLFNSYLLQNSPGSNAYLQTAFNDGPISGAATGLVSAIDALAIGFFQSASAIVSRPSDPQPNQIGGGPFARLIFGGTKTNLSSNGGGSGSASSFTNGSTTFSGFQAGFDVGVYNIDSSDWNINLGFFGGVANAGTFASTTSPDPIGGSLLNTTQLSVSVPFVALYTFISKASFSAEINVRRDFYNGTMSSFTNATNTFLVSPNTPLTGTGWSLNANISNRFNVKDWLYVEPLVSLSWGTYHFDNMPFNPALGLGSSGIKFDPIEILLGRVGANVGATFTATDNLALAPFVHGSVWHDFAKPATASALVSGGAASVNFGITSDRIGTFGQVGAGVQFKVLDIDLLGFVRGDLLFGNNITGAALNIGLRKQF